MKNEITHAQYTAVYAGQGVYVLLVKRERGNMMFGELNRSTRMLHFYACKHKFSPESIQELLLLIDKINKEK